MATANSTFTELVTTTIRNRTKKLADNVTNNNALLQHLRKKGNVKTFSGGRTIVQELEFAENSAFNWYSGYEQVSVAPSEVLSAAEYQIKQAAVAISMSGLEQLQNAGNERMIELLSARVKNAEKTLLNQVATACYSDGTGNGGKEIGGLQHIIADTATSGTVGGIDRATWSFWQNYSFDATTTGGAAATSANIEGYMDTVWLNLVRGPDKSTAIFADNNYYKLFLQSQQSLRRIMNSESVAKDSFSSIEFQNARVYFDGGIGGAASSNHMYFVNSDYLFFRPHSQRNFSPIGGEREAVNQDAMVKLIGFAGNMTCSGCQFQGVLKD